MAVKSSKKKGQYNLYRVLRSIWLNSGVSRLELCEKLDLDKATMSVLVSLLLRLELVEEVAPNIVKDQPGRKPVGLRIQKEFGYILGFEYHVSGLDVVIKDMHFNTIETFRFPERIRLNEISSSFFRAYSEVKGFLKEKRLLGVGVSIPGIVDQKNGIIRQSRELGVVDKPYDFKKEVFDILNIPGFIDNDANCCAWGILTDQRTKEYTNFLYTFLTYNPSCKSGEGEGSHLGVGSGIVIDGKIYCGPDGTTGELQPFPYGTGNNDRFNRDFEDPDTYKNSPQVRLKIFTDLAKHLGLLINFFNFSHLFIGGDLPEFNNDYAEIVQDAIDKSSPYGENHGCTIHIQKEGRILPSFGAAGMFFQELFTIPELEDQKGAVIWRKIFYNRDLLDL